MVTKEQATLVVQRGKGLYTVNDLFHYGECKQSIGARGGVIVYITRFRRTGKTITWKRDASRFKVPIKYGRYESSYITEDNCDKFHLATECPLDKGR